MSRNIIKKRLSEGFSEKFIPSHFIGFQIYDTQIHERIANVQKKIVERNPLLEKALIDLRTLHITFAAVQLENSQRIEELKEKLEKWSEDDMKLHFLQPITLTFKGVGTFGSTVAYARVQECDNHMRLCELGSSIHNFLSINEIPMSHKPFRPHLTLMKLTRDRKLLKKKRSFSNDFQEISQFQDEFGSQNIKAIQLLSMVDKKDDDGYYKCLWKRDTDGFYGTDKEETMKCD